MDQNSSRFVQKHTQPQETSDLTSVLANQGFATKSYAFPTRFQILIFLNETKIYVFFKLDFLLFFNLTLFKITYHWDDCQFLFMWANLKKSARDQILIPPLFGCFSFKWVIIQAIVLHTEPEDNPTEKKKSFFFLNSIFKTYIFPSFSEILLRTVLTKGMHLNSWSRWMMQP